MCEGRNHPINDGKRDFEEREGSLQGVNRGDEIRCETDCIVLGHWAMVKK